MNTVASYNKAQLLSPMDTEWCINGPRNDYKHLVLHITHYNYNWMVYSYITNCNWSLVSLLWVVCLNIAS